MTIDSSSTIPVWSGLDNKLDNIKGVICDLWGVLHDGRVQHQDAVECLINIRARGIPVALLSNSPKPVNEVWRYLADLGIPKSVADVLISSGSIARRMIRETKRGQKMYHIGPAERDAATLEGLPIEYASSPEAADFILCTGLNETTGEAHRSMLKEAALASIPMICANPDRIVHVREELQLCAGVVGDVYQSLGGTVVWAGKPNILALHSAAKALNLSVDETSIIMIGDSFQTDIAGAANAGYKAILIAGGIHRDDILPILESGPPTYEQLAEILHRDSHAIPALESIMPSLKW